MVQMRSSRRSIEKRQRSLEAMNRCIFCRLTAREESKYSIFDSLPFPVQLLDVLRVGRREVLDRALIFEHGLWQYAKRDHSGTLIGQPHSGMIAIWKVLGLHRYWFSLKRAWTFATHQPIISRISLEATGINPIDEPKYITSIHAGLWEIAYWRCVWFERNRGTDTIKIRLKRSVYCRYLQIP